MQDARAGDAKGPVRLEFSPEAPSEGAEGAGASAPRDLRSAWSCAAPPSPIGLASIGKGRGVGERWAAARRLPQVLVLCAQRLLRQSLAELAACAKKAKREEAAARAAPVAARRLGRPPLPRQGPPQREGSGEPQAEPEGPCPVGDCQAPSAWQPLEAGAWLREPEAPRPPPRAEEPVRPTPTAVAPAPRDIPRPHSLTAPPGRPSKLDRRPSTARPARRLCAQRVADGHEPPGLAAELGLSLYLATSGAQASAPRAALAQEQGGGPEAACATSPRRRTPSWLCETLAAVPSPLLQGPRQSAAQTGRPERRSRRFSAALWEVPEWRAP